MCFKFLPYVLLLPYFNLAHLNGYSISKNIFFSFCLLFIRNTKCEGNMPWIDTVGNCATSILYVVGHRNTDLRIKISKYQHLFVYLSVMLMRINFIGYSLRKLGCTKVRKFAPTTSLLVVNNF
jgi:hypothetical protein